MAWIDCEEDNLEPCKYNLRIYDSSSGTFIDNIQLNDIDENINNEGILLGQNWFGHEIYDNLNGIIDNPIAGCTDPNAYNFDVVASEDDGSCQYGEFSISNAGWYFDQTENMSFYTFNNYFFGY